MTNCRPKYTTGLGLFLGMVLLFGANVNAQSKSRPNIVLINADDLGYGDLGCYGAKLVSTPNIDKLAEGGKRFLDAHSASAVCSPSRWGLMTGMYPHRKNFWGPANFREPLTIDTQQLTLPKLLKECGYETACIGKWHLGFGQTKTDWNQPLKPGPLEIGFDSFYGIPCVNSGPPFVFIRDHQVVNFDPKDPFVYGQKSVTKSHPEKGGYKAIGGAIKAHQEYDDEMVATKLTKEAVSWLQNQSASKPFFLYFATTNIHHPFTPAKRFVGTSRCGLYGDFIHELDWMVGEITKTLQEKKLFDNTLIVFTSDNGGMFHVTGQKAWKAGHRLNGRLQGFKFGAWEGGHRVPFIAHWPGHIKPGSTSRQLISQIDLLATFAAVVEQSIPEDANVDSLNQLPEWVGESKQPIRDRLVISPNSPKHLAVRKGNWVYIPEQGAGGFQGKKPGNHLFSDAPALPFCNREHSDYRDGRLVESAPAAQLYHLEKDPGQTKNLVKDYPEKVKELQAILRSHVDNIPDSRRIGWINLKQK